MGDFGRLVSERPSCSRSGMTPHRLITRGCHGFSLPSLSGRWEPAATFCATRFGTGWSFLDSRLLSRNLHPLQDRRKVRVARRIKSDLDKVETRFPLGLSR